MKSSFVFDLHFPTDRFDEFIPDKSLSLDRLKMAVDFSFGTFTEMGFEVTQTDWANVFVLEVKFETKDFSFLPFTEQLGKLSGHCYPYSVRLVFEDLELKFADFPFLNTPKYSFGSFGMSYELMTRPEVDLVEIDAAVIWGDPGGFPLKKQSDNFARFAEKFSTYLERSILTAKIGDAKNSGHRTRLLNQLKATMAKDVHNWH